MKMIHANVTFILCVSCECVVIVTKTNVCVLQLSNAHNQIDTDNKHFVGHFFLFLLFVLSVARALPWAAYGCQSACVFGLFTMRVCFIKFFEIKLAFVSCSEVSGGGCGYVLSVLSFEHEIERENTERMKQTKKCIYCLLSC